MQIQTEKRAWDFGNGNDGYKSDERILPSEIDLSWFNGDPNPFLQYY